MQTILDLVRGIGIYVWIFAAGMLYGWLVLPYNDKDRIFLCVGGGGALLLAGTVVLLFGVFGTKPR